MNVDIQSIRENPLLERRQVKVSVKHEGEATPSREDIKNRFAAENGLDEENIEVDTIETGFGGESSETELKVYEDFDYSEDLEEETDTTTEETEVTSDEKEIVSGTITDAKEAVKEFESPDYEALIQAEKQDKNRTTLIEWLESQK